VTTRLLGFISVILISLIAAVCVSVSWAGNEGPFARLISFGGIVSIEREAASLPVEKGMNLQKGDKIRTDAASFADVAFEKDKKNVIRIDQDSEVVLKNIDPNATEIDLFGGKVLSRVKKLNKKSTFTVKTPISVTGARGSGWAVSTGTNDAVESHEDKIFVAGLDANGNPIGETDVYAGWKIFVNQFEGPAGLTELTESEREKWNSWKESLGESGDTGSGDTGNTDIEKAADKIEQGLTEKKEDLFESGDTDRVDKRIEGGSEQDDDNGHPGTTPF